MMRFDLVPHYSPGTPKPWAEVTREMTEESVLAEQIGMTAIWVGEHHFGTPHVDNGATNPAFLDLHIANHTKKLRVGQIPTVITDHHPLRVAEEIAMLDVLSGGRAEFGVGRGTNDRSCIQWFPAADRRNDEVNYRLFIENLEVIVGAWTQEAFTHQGEFWTFPVPGWKEENHAFRALDTTYYGAGGEMVALDVRPKPLQKPHPPIWMATEKAKSHEYAGERGYGMLSWAVHKDRMLANWEAYQRGAQRAGRMNERFGERMAVMHTIHVARTMEEAAAQCRYGVNKQWDFSTGSKPAVWAKKWFAPTGMDLTPEHEAMDWFDFLQSTDGIWVGTPEYVAEKIEQYRSEIGLEHLILWPQLFELGHKNVMNMLELFAAEVMPKFESVGLREPVGAGA